MIRIKNQAEFPIVMKIKGTLTTTVGAQQYDFSEPVPFDGFIKAVYAEELTAGSGGAETVDLLINGSSVVSTGTLFSFADGAASPTYNTANLNDNPTPVAKGDILAISVAAVHSTTAGADLAVAVVVERGRQPKAAAMETGTYGLNSDEIN